MHSSPFLVTNLLAELPRDLAAEQFQPLISAQGVRIERIVSLGHSSPSGFWYDQEQHEAVLLIQGAARLRFADDADPIDLVPGTLVNIPAHKRHRIDSTDPTQPTIWLAIHYGAP